MYFYYIETLLLVCFVHCMKSYYRFPLCHRIVLKYDFAEHSTS